MSAIRRFTLSSLVALGMLCALTPQAAVAEDAGDCTVECSVNTSGQLECKLVCKIIIHF